MSIAREMPKRLRALHAVAILADRQPHSTAELAMQRRIGMNRASDIQATREVLYALVDRGYVVIVGNTRSGQLFQLAERFENGQTA